jgi:5-methylcytosine-specific restriction endonuclease McrA
MESLFQSVPICNHPGCNKPCHYIQKKILKDGTLKYYYRKFCGTHYYGALAKKQGFVSLNDRFNSRHKYRKYRKDYCENIDGRLGFICTTNIFWLGMLDVDHINEDSTDNRLENLQTLCSCCHEYKTYLFNNSGAAKPLGRTKIRKNKEAA